WEQLQEQIPASEAIMRDNASLSIFSTPEWLGSWWKAFGSSKRMHALAFSIKDNSLVGLALFYFDEIHSPVFGKLTRLRLVGDGSGYSDNLDLIFQPGLERVCSPAPVSCLPKPPNRAVCSWY